MIPHPLACVVLVFAAYRLTRLAGWDDFPPIYKMRAWVIGETWVPEASLMAIVLDDNAAESDGLVKDTLPGKQPSSEVPTLRPAYSRPLIAHLVHCPFCVGWWISLATYLAWLWQPTITLYAAAPFALSGVVGIIAKNWDA